MRFHVLVLFTLLSSNCQVSEGESCLCAADCKGSLVCAIEGDILESGECTPKGAAAAGTCVPADDVPSETTLGTGGPFMDAGSKKDFEPTPPMPPMMTSGTTTATSTSTVGSDTGTSTSTSGAT
jgi:hypothetical protein